MKIIIFLLFVFLTLNLTSAQSLEDISNVPGQLEEIPTTPEDIREQYLQREWTEVFRNNRYFSWIYDFNPIFKFLFGYEFSISWAFVTAFLVWLVIFSLFYPPARLMFKETFVALGSSIATSAISAQFLVPLVVASLSKTIQNIWQNLSSIAALIVMAFIVGKLSKTITIQIKKAWHERRIRNLEEKVEKTGEKSEELEEIKAISKGYKENKLN